MSQKGCLSRFEANSAYLVSLLIAQAVCCSCFMYHHVLISSAANRNRLLCL
jgi:hypothetical protein